jgi:CRP-like cAMP-binding protein
MTYDYYSAGRTIFEKGEQGDTLYVILKGEVEVIDPAAQKPSELSDDETED